MTGRVGWSAVACMSVVMLAAASGAQDGKSVWDGVYTETQAERGRIAFDQECVSCHGSNLLGTENGPELVGDGFLANVSGKTVGDLFDYMRETMPADSPGRLSEQQYSDIIAFFFNMNHLPAGPRELDHDSAALKQIAWPRNRP